jgi:mono/diheme cytochrome c family protein
MRKRSKIDLFAGAAALFAVFIVGGGGASAGEVDAQDFTTVAKGRYLSILSDCASCHTVPQKSQPFAGGRPIETPFGKIVAPNITPDMETGIGSWTDDQFDNAVRKGIGRKGERLYPAMPFNAYTKMSREDVLAIRAYQHGDGGVQSGRRQHAAVPVQHPHVDAGLGRPLLQGRRIRRRSA